MYFVCTYLEIFCHCAKLRCFCYKILHFVHFMKDRRGGGSSMKLSGTEVFKLIRYISEPVGLGEGESKNRTALYSKIVTLRRILN